MLKLGELNVILGADDKPLKEGLGKARKESADAGDDAGSGFGEMFGSAAAAAMATAAAAIGAGFATSLSLDAARSKLAAQVGDPNLVAQIGQVAGRVYGRGFGQGLEGAMDAVRAVMAANLVPAGDRAAIEDMTVAVQAYADAWGTDAAEATTYASSLLNNKLARDATNALDLITAASGRVPAALRGDLLEAADEYGQYFHSIGFTGEQAFAALVAASQKGKFSLDKTGDAVKEFSLLATNLDDTGDAYTRLGLNGQEMSNALLRGGAGATAATQQIINALMSIQDPTEQASLALKFFGTPMEDLGKHNIPQFLANLAAAGPGLDGVAGASKRAGDAIESSATGRLTAFRNQVQAAFVEKLGEAVPFLEKTIVVLREHQGIVTGVAVGLGVFVTAVGAAKAATMAYHGAMLIAHTSQAAWAAVTRGAAASQAAFTAAMNSGLVASARAGVALAAQRVAMIASTVATGAATAAQWLLNVAMSANPIGLIVLAVMALIGVFVLLWNNCEGFRNFWLGLWEGIKAAASAVGEWFAGPFCDFFTQTWAWIVGKWNGLVDFVTGLPGRISAAAAGMWNGIKDSFRAALNWIIGKWNGLSFHIPSIDTHIPGVGRVGGMTLNLPDIPYLARGGDITRAGMAVIAERGPEVVHLPAGASVRPLNRSAGPSTGGQPVARVEGQILIRGDGILAGLREVISVRGGNVQAVLGG